MVSTETMENTHHEKNMECVSREANEMRRLDIIIGCCMASVVLVNHNIFTFNALMLVLILQVVRYKIELCEAVYVTTYRITSMTERIDYMNYMQLNRVSFKFSTYIILLVVTICIYAVTINSYVLQLVKLSVALATIFM